MGDAVGVGVGSGVGLGVGVGEGVGVGTGVTSTWIGGRGVAVAGAAVTGSAVGAGAASTVAAGFPQAARKINPKRHMHLFQQDRFIGDGRSSPKRHDLTQYLTRPIPEKQAGSKGADVKNLYVSHVGFATPIQKGLPMRQPSRLWNGYCFLLASSQGRKCSS